MSCIALPPVCAPAPVAVAPVCIKHGSVKVLRHDYVRGRVNWRCRRCERDAQIRSAQRTAVTRLTSLASRVLRADAGRVERLADRLALSCGGWERLEERLTEDQRLALAVRLAGAADELASRAAEQERRDRAAVEAGARDPAVIATAARLLEALPPRELRPVLERLFLRCRDRRWLQGGDGSGI